MLIGLLGVLVGAVLAVLGFWAPRAQLKQSREQFEAEDRARHEQRRAHLTVDEGSIGPSGGTITIANAGPAPAKHVAVYVADDLVFTKNGTSPVAPWTIMPLDRVKDYYRNQSENPRLIYHRRNDL